MSPEMNPSLRRAPLPLIILLGWVALAGGCSKAAPRPADLTVRLSADHSLPMYIEGFIPFVRLDRGGTTLFDGRMQIGGSPVWSLSRSLAAGSYRVTSYVRPCDANCGVLDHPTDTCAMSVSLTAGSRVEIDVSLRPSHGCTMTRR
jgi:hypothetical protein